MFHFPQHSLQQITGSYKQLGMSNTGEKWQCWWNPVSSTTAATPWSTEKSKPGEELVSEKGTVNPRYQSSGHQDSQPWGSPTVWLPGQAKPSWYPRQLLPWSTRCTKVHRLITLFQQIQAWPQDERGLGRWSVKKTASPVGADLSQAHSKEPAAQNLHGVTHSTMLQRHSTRKVTPHQQEQESAFNHIQWELKTMERAQTQVRFLAGQ